MPSARHSHRSVTGPGKPETKHQFKSMELLIPAGCASVKWNRYWSEDRKEQQWWDDGSLIRALMVHTPSMRCLLPLGTFALGNLRQSVGLNMWSCWFQRVMQAVSFKFETGLKIEKNSGGGIKAGCSLIWERMVRLQWGFPLVMGPWETQDKLSV